jgi:lysophospholipase L1-like esterase
LNLPQGHVVAVSIPTWSFVPAAADFGGPERVGRMTAVFNEVAREEATARRFKWIDITEASTSGIGSRGWIASDQLHPGDTQYSAWAEVIWESVREPWA